MAEINETIKNGFYRVWDPINLIWKRIALWTKGEQVVCTDGNTVESKVGAINGITDSLVSDASDIAASAAAVNVLNQNLNGFSFDYTADGKPGFREAGADAVVPFKSGFLNSGEAMIIINSHSYPQILDIKESGIVTVPVVWYGVLIVKNNSWSKVTGTYTGLYYPVSTIKDGEITYYSTMQTELSFDRECEYIILHYTPGNSTQTNIIFTFS